MCRPNSNTPPQHASSSAKRQQLGQLLLLQHPRRWLTVAAVLWPIVTMPTWCFLNRGYTQWFHWNALLYMAMSSSQQQRQHPKTTNHLHWHAQFLAVQGLTVTLGWYASLYYDWHVNGRLAHILYWNMPDSMTQYMLSAENGQGQGQVVVYNAVSVAVMCLAHVLDTLGHPVLAYYFWKRSAPPHKHLKSAATRLFTRFSWSVLLCSYLLSRIWSITHTWYNHGTPALFYFGYDVYTIHDRDCWMEGLWLPAYVTEAVITTALVLGKACVEWQSSSAAAPIKTSTTTTSERRPLDRVPSTLLRSTVSEEADEND